jgi:tetratricopeptide (TPR) repeat protein
MSYREGGGDTTGKRRPRAVVWLVVGVVVIVVALVVLLTGLPLDRPSRLRGMELEALRRAARDRPNDPELFLELGRRLRQLGEPRAAAVMSGRAYDLSRGEPRFVAARVRALADMGETEEALRLVQQALPHAPDSGELWAELAAVEARRGRFADALGEAREAVRIAPGLEDAWRALGNACAANKRPDEAFAAFERAWRLEPMDTELLADYGEALARFGRPAQAETLLEDAVKVAPGAARPVALLGEIKAGHARTPAEREIARAFLRQALARAPAAADTLYHLALLEEQDRRFQEAVPLLLQCLAIDPGYGEAHLVLGRVYRRQGRATEAAQAFAAWQRFSDYRREAAHLELRLRRQPGNAALRRRLAELRKGHTDL